MRRWHAKHGFAKEAFTQARNRMPILDLLESQVRAAHPMLERTCLTCSRA